MKELLKRLLRLVLGDYAAYRIYTRPTGAAPPPRSEKSAGFQVREIGAAELLASPDTLIREQAGYLGEGACGFACYDSERVAGVCFYWFGARYLKRNFWPLKEREAKLVQIVTLPELRGREVAPTLIAASCAAMQAKGFERAYARIWHSNTPSLRAFARAGWTESALVFEVNPLRLRRPFRIPLTRAA